ncbi:MAG TPA: hypothetical protein VGC18_03580 [Lacisediminihabitans sp.]|uniref:hypothetical protein n=1 Tax=Lacisediminihabitans sp. TaxID=2787631 RepID=UPI002EDADB71
MRLGDGHADRWSPGADADPQQAVAYGTKPCRACRLAEITLDEAAIPYSKLSLGDLDPMNVTRSWRGTRRLLW